MIAAQDTLPPLKGDGERVVDYLIKQGIGLFVLLHKFLGKSSEAVRKTLERLRDDGWIERYPLPGNRGSYWRLSSLAVNRFGLKRDARPLKSRTLVRQAMSAHFFAENSFLVRLSARECAEQLPQIYGKGNSNCYFYDVSEATEIRLGWLLIDDGKTATRVVQKIRDVISKKKTNVELFELMTTGRFYLAVATATREKAEQIEKALHDHPLTHAKVRVVPICGDATGENEFIPY